MSITKFKKKQTTDEFAEMQAERKRKVCIDPNFNPLAVDDGGPCCGPVAWDPPKPVVLQVSKGAYEITGSRYPLVRLAVEVLRHRAWHFIRGEGFRD